MSRRGAARRLPALTALLAALAIVALLLAPASPASAAKPRASFNDIENEVMCDTCNVPLNIAESPRADQERREIRDMIAQGMTKQQIKDELVRRYGPQILALPPRSGFDLAAYAVPAVAVLLLAGAVVLLLPRWRRRGRAAAATGAPGGAATATAAAPELSAADAARLDEELARWDR
jgi:cytochrome c-type biogenesis protein CcmH